MITFLSVGIAAAIAPVCSSKQKEPPFACNMNALSSEERARLPKIFDRLTAEHPVVTELPNGYELSFARSNGLFPLATEWASDEIRCCPFFDFSLTVVRHGGPMVVRITGPDGVKSFISEDLPRLHRLTSK
jgi:hypothetical protein